MVRIEQLAPNEVYAALGSSPEGLSPEEAHERLEKYGPNVLREAKRTSLIVRFLANFTHLMAILLWAAAVMAFVAQMPQLGVAVIAVIIINAVFSFWQEFRAERATEELKKLLPVHARVIRGGEEQQIPASDLVPGDVVLLSEGDHVSADARLVEEFELRTNNSTLTGESVPIRRTAEAVLATDLARTEIANMVFAGTTVATGTARAVVTATGMNTEFGRIADLTQTVHEEPSPMQVEINRVVQWITVTALGLGVVFFLLGTVVAGMRFAEAFIFGIGIIVAFVPEGLLPTVTLSLAMGVQRMARRHALIKKLSAVETLGSTTVICTDKTGTLTQNEMTVRKLWVGGRELDVTGYGYEPAGQVEEGGRAAAREQPDIVALLTAATLCNNARLLAPNGDSGRWSILGDPTEGALVVAAHKYGLAPEQLAARYPRQRELPFDSRRKRMSTINQGPGERLVAYVKGAPNEVLSLCSHVQIGGEVHPLGDALRARIVAANDRYARQALRVLAVACRAFDECEYAGCTADTVEKGLTFLGLIAMMDPPRPEVARAVELCHQAHVRIIMITGDHGLTAESIARRVGILRGEHGRVISGVELERMPEDELLQILKSGDDLIFARVSPEHKLRVVSALKELGEVVAVTGDGVNDAPALKRADIGVAMGLSGTDVAKEAADMILTDDNFASIVNAIEEGRAVYNNIKKFTTYIFSSNVPEAIPFIAFVLSGGRIPLPLTVMQILAVDLGTDMVPALALGADLPEPGLMQCPPRSKKAHLIDLPLLARAYLWLGMFEGIFAMIAFYWVYWTRGYAGVLMPLPGPVAAFGLAAEPVLYATATAATLSSIIPGQIGNIFACRSERVSSFRMGFSSNRLIWLGIACELLVIMCINYLRPLQAVFGTAPLRLSDWLFFFAITPILLLAEEGRKLVVRQRARANERKWGKQRCDLSSSVAAG